MAVVHLTYCRHLVEVLLTGCKVKGNRLYRVQLPRLERDQAAGRTTRIEFWILRRLNAKDECCDVIVLACVSYECVHVVHDAVECFRRALNCPTLKIGHESPLAVLLLYFVYSFDKAIRECKEHVAGTKLGTAQVIAGSILLKRGDSKWGSADTESLYLTGGASEDRMIMSRVHIDELPRVNMEFSKKCCREAASLQTVRAAIAVEVGDDLIQGRRSCGQCMEA